jgi:small subunit ribosomal protein S8
MDMTDPIADMLTRIRNAVRARHPRVDIPFSGMKLEIARILKAEGYIADVSVVERGAFRDLRVALRYDGEGNSLIAGLALVSKPGRRVYTGYREIPPVMGGLGLAIVSTPRGLMSGRDAKRARVGGEVVCGVW